MLNVQWGMLGMKVSARMRMRVENDVTLGFMVGVGVRVDGCQWSPFRVTLVLSIRLLL